MFPAEPSAVLEGRIHALHTSRGGVPKRPLPEVRVTTLGVEGDAHNDLRHHGGPERAVSLLALEVIEKISNEGHPIAPGTTGENVTVAGLDWARVIPGTRLEFEGGVVLEIASFCFPCRTISRSFTGGGFRRMDSDRHPGESRVYARVLAEGTLRNGERVRLHETVAPSGPCPAPDSLGAG